MALVRAARLSVADAVPRTIAATRRPVSTPPAVDDARFGFRLRRRRLSVREQAQWLRQIAALLRAGLPLVSALDSPAVRAVVRRAEVRHRLARLGRMVEGGASLSQALERFGAPFDGFAVQVIVAGETAGNLDEALLRVAARAERTAELWSTLLRALLYPSIVVCVAGAAVLLLLLFVVPVFAEMFAELGEGLPLPTQWVLALSGALLRWAPLLLPLGLAALAGGAALLRLPAVRVHFDAALLRVPVVGNLARAAAVANCCATLATLVRSGVPVFDGLAVAAGTAGNGRVARCLRDAQRAVGHGHSLAQCLGASTVFPAATTALIAIGEESGSLDLMLESAATLARDEVERSAGTLLSLLEPAIVVGLALLVGFIAVAMYLPVFRLGGVIHG